MNNNKELQTNKSKSDNSNEITSNYTSGHVQGSNRKNKTQMKIRFNQNFNKIGESSNPNYFEKVSSNKFDELKQVDYIMSDMNQDAENIVKLSEKSIKINEFGRENISEIKKEFDDFNSTIKVDLIESNRELVLNQDYNSSSAKGEKTETNDKDEEPKNEAQNYRNNRKFSIIIAFVFTLVISFIIIFLSL